MIGEEANGVGLRGAVGSDGDETLRSRALQRGHVEVGLAPQQLAQELGVPEGNAFRQQYADLAVEGLNLEGRFVIAHVALALPGDDVQRVGG